MFFVSKFQYEMAKKNIHNISYISGVTSATISLLNFDLRTNDGNLQCLWFSVVFNVKLEHKYINKRYSCYGKRKWNEEICQLSCEISDMKSVLIITATVL